MISSNSTADSRVKQDWGGEGEEMKESGLTFAE